MNKYISFRILALVLALYTCTAFGAAGPIDFNAWKTNPNKSFYTLLDIPLGADTGAIKKAFMSAWKQAGDEDNKEFQQTLAAVKDILFKEPTRNVYKENLKYGHAYAYQEAEIARTGGGGETTEEKAKKQRESIRKEAYANLIKAKTAATPAQSIQFYMQALENFNVIFKPMAGLDNVSISIYKDMIEIYFSIINTYRNIGDYTQAKETIEKATNALKLLRTEIIGYYNGEVQKIDDKINSKKEDYIKKSPFSVAWEKDPQVVQLRNELPAFTQGKAEAEIALTNYQQRLDALLAGLPAEGEPEPGEQEESTIIKQAKKIRAATRDYVPKGVDVKDMAVYNEAIEKLKSLMQSDGTLHPEIAPFIMDIYTTIMIDNLLLGGKFALAESAIVAARGELVQLRKAINANVPPAEKGTFLAALDPYNDQIASLQDRLNQAKGGGIPPKPMTEAEQEALVQRLNTLTNSLQSLVKTLKK